MGARESHARGIEPFIHFSQSRTSLMVPATCLAAIAQTYTSVVDRCDAWEAWRQRRSEQKGALAPSGACAAAVGSRLNEGDRKSGDSIL